MPCISAESNTKCDTKCRDLLWIDYLGHLIHRKRSPFPHWGRLSGQSRTPVPTMYPRLKGVFVPTFFTTPPRFWWGGVCLFWVWILLLIRIFQHGVGVFLQAVLLGFVPQTAFFRKLCCLGLFRRRQVSHNVAESTYSRGFVRGCF